MISSKAPNPVHTDVKLRPPSPPDGSAGAAAGWALTGRSISLGLRQGDGLAGGSHPPLLLNTYFLLSTSGLGPLRRLRAPSLVVP